MQEVNSILQFIGFIVGLLGIPIAIWKYFEDSRRQRELAADGLYQKYLEIAMKYPELSWPDEKILEDPRYPWFVALLLNTLSTQLAYKPKRDMREAIKTDLKLHQKYLESKAFKIEGGWSLFPPQLMKIYDEVRE